MSYSPESKSMRMYDSSSSRLGGVMVCLEGKKTVQHRGTEGGVA